jgi:hypothetical protein
MQTFFFISEKKKMHIHNKEVVLIRFICSLFYNVKNVKNNKFVRIWRSFIKNLIYCYIKEVNRKKTGFS